MLQLERDNKAAQDRQERQLEASRERLEAETAHRVKLEKSLSNQKADLAKLKDHNTKLDRELNKALTELKNREWEVKQLESRQDKTIVEHVHVLEEAKRFTDRQFAEAQVELQKNAAYIRSLEQAKIRLTGEAQDLVRVTEREQIELRNREKASRAQEERTAKAIADAERERHAKDVAELQTRRLQGDLQSASRQIEELEQQLSIVQRSKANLETELDRLADETLTPNSMAKFQRQYEARIAELESQLEAEESAATSAARLRERVDRQHAEIRHLVMNSGPVDSTFQSRLLHELQLIDDALEKELPLRSNHNQLRSSSTNDFRTMANLSPSKRDSNSIHSPKDSSHDPSRASERQLTALRQHVQVLEIQIAASERVRQHLETSIHEMTADLESSDGSKQSIQQYRARLAKENARLKELLAEEAEARRAAEAAQVDGVQAMWIKFQSTISEERKNYSRLEESRKALVKILKVIFLIY